jgi:anti-anti-sigma regulatory factor
MPDRLTIATQRQDGLLHVRLAGVIDEDSALDEAGRQVRPGEILAIDTSEVTRINSCGVREWVNWLSRLEAQGARVVLVGCSVHIVDQINMVHNFVGSGQVKSFQLIIAQIYNLPVVKCSRQFYQPITRFGEYIIRQWYNFFISLLFYSRHNLIPAIIALIFLIKVEIIKNIFFFNPRI